MNQPKPIICKTPQQKGRVERAALSYLSKISKDLISYRIFYHLLCTNMAEKFRI